MAHVPGDVPELRLWLMDEWLRPGSGFAAAELYRLERDAERGIVPPGGVELATAVNVRWNARHLAEATLWWVSADMVDLLMAAVPSVPDDVQPAQLPMPSDAGLVVFERPWLGQDSERPDRTIPVDGLLWGRTQLPRIKVEDARDFPDHLVGAQALSVECYARIPESGFWAPYGRSDWPMPDDLGTVPWRMADSAGASFIEDRRVLAALWTLLSQPGIADVAPRPAPRPARRRMQRAGLPPEAANVTVATLRKVDRREGAPEHGEGTPRHHRWYVVGHWRNARVGPGRSERRLTWVRPHVRGQGPLLEKDRVNAWTR